jgi:type IV secretion system protein VirB7
VNRPASIALLSLLSLGACQSHHELASAKGPLFALNPGRWQPTAQDLTLTESKQGALPTAPPIVERPPAPVALSTISPQGTR